MGPTRFPIPNDSRNTHCDCNNRRLLSRRGVDARNWETATIVVATSVLLCSSVKPPNFLGGIPSQRFAGAVVQKRSDLFEAIDAVPMKCG